MVLRVMGLQVGRILLKSSPAARAVLAAPFLLTACQTKPPVPPTPTPRPTAQVRETWPSFHLRVEGSGSAYLTISRTELPCIVALAGENASGSLTLYEHAGELITHSVAPPPGREPNLRVLTTDLQEVIPLRISANGMWRVYVFYLDRGNFMEIPGRMSGSGPHIIYFTVGEPRYVRIEADPGEGTILLHAIGDNLRRDLLAASTLEISDVYALSPELYGLQIRTSGTWTIHVVDRADLLK